MKISLRSIESIRPYPRNARKIPSQALDKVAASILEFGWQQPVVVDKHGVIICGHVRYLAALKLGLKEVPVVVAENLTPAQVRAYRLMDNRSHQETSWDYDLAGLEMLDLQGLGLDLTLTGFDMPEIDDLLARAKITAGLTDPDYVPEVPETAVSLPGDLWLLGDHRLLCGDSTLRNDVERVLGGTKADMTFSDPPFNVAYHQPARRGRAAREITNDNLGDAFGAFLGKVCENLIQMTDGAIYLCMSSSELHTLQKAFTSSGGHWSTFIIWAKDRFTLGRSDYQRQYEPILYGWREGSNHYWCGARDQGDIWFVDKPLVNDLHPTQKPTELIVRAIENSSRGGQTVLDGFGGSGSTLIACEQTGRRARLVELEPQYVDTALLRWQQFTGKDAVLEGDGRTFKVIREERIAVAPTSRESPPCLS